MSTSTHHTLQQRWKALAPREQNLVLAASAIVALALLWWVALAPALKTLRTAPARHAALDAQLQRMQSLQAEALQLQAAPRGTPGSRELMGASTGMDYIGNEVGAAVAELMRDKARGQGLAKLAELRYLHVPASTVREQMRVLGIAEGADRTYRNWVQQLHQRVMLILVIRSATTRGHMGKRQVGDHCKVTNKGAGRRRV